MRLFRLIKNPTSFVVGGLVLGSLELLRLVSSATEDKVWLFGGELHIGCWFRDLFSIPCPACGMTRSILLSLQFDLPSAAQLNIGGPLIVIGLFCFGGLMLLCGITARSSRFPRMLIMNTAVYFGAVSIFAIFAWSYKFLL